MKPQTKITTTPSKITTTTADAAFKSPDSN